VDLISLVIFLLIGAAAGWLAGLLMRGGGFGLLGVSSGGGLIGSLVTAVAGAAVLLLIGGLIKKA
jgi:uncharacterized membrane protein YeaQ/YmgE (transglycosylase-associated protein family)